MRTEMLISALQWLLENNSEWKQRRISLDVIKESLRNPVLVDNSITEESPEQNTNRNIERTELFQVFFPDGTMSPLTGGQENIKQFKELLQVAQENGYDLSFRCDLMNEAVPDYKDNNLVNACLLQFPYGRGGMNEQRQKPDGSFVCNTDISEYTKHLSLLSQRHFHSALFTLILYNLAMKQEMVKQAGWRVRNKISASTIAQELTADDVSQAINAKCHGNVEYNSRGHLFLNAVNAVTKAAPHTNQAAKSARHNGEAIQHRFGLASYFLTVTPDDESSFLIQIFSGVFIDDNQPVASLFDDVLASRAKERTQLRIQFPGICALFFQLMLNIVIEEVIGWDQKKEAAKENRGLFGIPEAFIGAIEEQGRTTLHVHFEIWIKDFNTEREQLYSNNRNIVRNGSREIAQRIDATASTLLLPAVNLNKKVFSHECTVSERLRHVPVIVDDQQLRNLRYQNGQTSTRNLFAYCDACTKSWTNTQLVESYLINDKKVPGLTEFPDGYAKRLKAMAIEYQKSKPDITIDGCIVDAAYNYHTHTSSCFGKKFDVSKSCISPTKKRKRLEQCECRYRMPQRTKICTVIQNASDSAINWYCWNGCVSKRHIKEVCIERLAYNAFQNVSCPAISHSKLTCNTNLAVIMPGPVSQYIFKYHLKGTQKDDTEEYERIAEATRKALSRIQSLEQTDSSRAIGRILAASFAHQKTNVVGPSMASYLTRHKSRFIMSHEFVWCPYRDIEALLKNGQTNVSILYNGSIPFFQCNALHYLCRPLQLKDLNAYDFFTQYEVVRTRRNNEEQLLPFYNHPFQHPSYRHNENRFLQGVRLRSKEKLLTVFKYDFPNSAQFSSSIISLDTDITEVMETYSKLALLLFLPYRQLNDLLLQGSFTKRFREALYTGMIREKDIDFLQNIQDVSSNCTSVSKVEDDLQRNTKAYKLQYNIFDDQNTESISDEETDTEANSEQLDHLLHLLELEGYDNATTDIINDRHETADRLLPPTFNLNKIRQKGVYNCGYEFLASMYTQSDCSQICYESEIEHNININEDNEATDSNIEQMPPHMAEIITILLSKTARRTRSFQDITNNDGMTDVMEANGSVKSIIDWAKNAKLDERQKRAFEIMTSCFILTFFSDEFIDESLGRGQRSRSQPYIEEKKKLEILSDKSRRGSDQLILFLHGPGGCGKTTVIDLFIEYAREYCGYMQTFQFTSRTIIITAMTGVAATLLLGETTHSALYLNQKKSIKPEQVEAWASTRLLIIDEISFASKEDFEQIHQNLRQLKQCINLPYGNLHIVFAGDMRQLEPVGANKKPVYAEYCAEFREWVNCYIELNGMHRFKDDPEWGYLLMRLRNGETTKLDIDKINERVVNSATILPMNIKYATYYNRDRDAINAALFAERCNILYKKSGNVNDSLMIFADELKVQNGSKTYVSFNNCMALWENCGEDDVKTPRTAGRMDPVLRLYRGCRIMLPCNKNVKAGQANGTQAIVERIVLKPNVTPKAIVIQENIIVSAVCASNVSHIVLRHSNNRVQPQIFLIEPKKYTFKAKILKPRLLQVKGGEYEMLEMKGIQLPILVNNATTGHKLQGSSVDNLFVHSWNYVTNWPYVMLSRVKTRKGLFCRKALSKDLSKYAVPDSLSRMLDKMHKRTPSYWSEEQYDEFFFES